MKKLINFNPKKSAINIANHLTDDHEERKKIYDVYMDRIKGITNDAKQWATLVMVAEDFIDRDKFENIFSKPKK